MEKLIVYILTPLIVILKGCNQPNREPLYENVIKRPFSDPAFKDELSIKVFGESLVGGTVVILIISSDGRIIYKQEHPASHLIGYGLMGEEATNIARMEEYITKRVDEFFIDDHFSNPAVSLNETFDNDYSELESWNSIQSDQTAIGFYYLIGEEAGCRIAYSKKEQQTLTYFCCC
jgi:hypothetical protein